MKKNIFTFLFTISIIYSGLSQDTTKQNYFGRSFIVNLSGTYIQDKTDYYIFHETTVSTQMGMSLCKPLYIGVQTHTIFTRDSYYSPEHYFLLGAYLQYDVIPFLIQQDLFTYTRARIFAETSIDFGNYNCCNFEPYPPLGLKYYGLGGGFDYPIGKSNFAVNCSMIFHKILNKIERKTAYNIYKIGISYSFGKGR